MVFALAGDSTMTRCSLMKKESRDTEREGSEKIAAGKAYSKTAFLCVRHPRSFEAILFPIWCLFEFQPQCHWRSYSPLSIFEKSKCWIFNSGKPITESSLFIRLPLKTFSSHRRILLMFSLIDNRERTYLRHRFFATHSEEMNIFRAHCFWLLEAIGDRFFR